MESPSSVVKRLQRCWQIQHQLGVFHNIQPEHGGRAQPIKQLAQRTAVAHQLDMARKQAAGLFSKPARETRELLPRYEQDNLFDSTQFKCRFPEFKVMAYRARLEQIQREWAGKSGLGSLHGIRA